MAKAALRPGTSTGTVFPEFNIRRKNTKNRWLWYEGIPSNNAGYNILSAITLTSITIITKNVTTANFSIRDASGELILISLTASDFKATTGLSINLSYQDEIKVYMDNTSGVDYPKVILGF